MVLDALESKGWTILATQVPVGNVDARLGTAVDIKCRDRDGRIILIELKCGYNGVFEMEWPASKEWAWCTGTMNHLPANAKHYSLIQVRLGRTAKQREYSHQEAPLGFSWPGPGCSTIDRPVPEFKPISPMS